MEKRVWLKKYEEIKNLSPKEYYKEEFKQIVEEIKENYRKYRVINNEEYEEKISTMNRHDHLSKPLTITAASDAIRVGRGRTMI